MVLGPPNLDQDASCFHEVFFGHLRRLRWGRGGVGKISATSPTGKMPLAGQCPKSTSNMARLSRAHISGRTINSSHNNEEATCMAILALDVMPACDTSRDCTMRIQPFRRATYFTHHFDGRLLPLAPATPAKAVPPSDPGLGSTPPNGEVQGPSRPPETSHRFRLPRPRGPAGE